MTNETTKMDSKIPDQKLQEEYQKYFTANSDAVKQCASPMGQFEIFTLTKNTVPLVYSNHLKR